MSLFKVAPLLIVLFLLQACGFRPLYGDGTPGKRAPEFELIKVEPIPDRIGQQLRNHLLTALNTNKRKVKPRYIMKTRIKEGTTSLAVRKSAFATRANLTVTASFQLIDSLGGKTIFSSSRSITVSYNILDSEFATLMAEKDARTRAVRELSEDIRTQLGVYFSRAQDTGKS